MAPGQARIAAMQCKPPVLTKTGAKENSLKEVTARIKINTSKRNNELF